MSNMKPRVSIGLPVYNGERFLAEAIESILGQTMTDFELVISDNASTDATEQICRRYQAQDSRVRYSRNERNLGANANFNCVVHLSSPYATYFSWAAHDDLCAPTYLERCVQMLDANPTAVLCHTRTRLIDAVGHSITAADAAVGGLQLPPDDPPRQLDSPYPHQRFSDILLKTRWCFEIFGLIRRDALLQTALQENYYGTDKVILATLALIGPFLEVPEELFLRRCHHQQSTSIRSAAARAAWSDPRTQQAPTIPQLPCLRGYVRAAKAAVLFPGERIACNLILARYVCQRRKLTALLRDVLHRLTRAEGREPEAITAGGPEVEALKRKFPRHPPRQVPAMQSRAHARR